LKKAQFSVENYFKYPKVIKKSANKILISWYWNGKGIGDLR